MRKVKAGRLPKQLPPLQSGVGAVANAVLYGMLDSEFENLTMYTEVLQDAVVDLIEAGKVTVASSCSLTLSDEKREYLYANFEKFKDSIILRPQEISNHSEVIRRLGVISMNTALEVDIYGNVNSTHVAGTKMMNGIGGSGDFARNARLAIFVTKSTAKNGDISSIVPFCSHIDHTEHDVDVIVTEQGYADLRGLLRESAPKPLLKTALTRNISSSCGTIISRRSQEAGILRTLLKKHFPSTKILLNMVRCSCLPKKKKQKQNKRLNMIDGPPVFSAGGFFSENFPGGRKKIMNMRAGRREYFAVSKRA